MFSEWNRFGVKQEEAELHHSNNRTKKRGESLEKRVLIRGWRAKGRSAGMSTPAVGFRVDYGARQTVMIEKPGCRCGY